MSSLDEAVTRHVELFNAAVSQSDFRALVDTFAPTAVMRFLGVPAGPFVGRDAIADAYRTSVANKFPPGYLRALTDAFQRVLRTYPPKTLDSRLVYDIYDEWKKACGAGRRVDLDRLIDWCQKRTAGEKKPRTQTTPSGRRAGRVGRGRRPGPLHRRRY